MFIKVYEVNWGYKLIVSLNALKFKYRIKYHHGNILNNGKRIIRDIIHIISITPFINTTIKTPHIELVNTFVNIVSSDLIMYQILHSYSFWSLYKGSIINIEKNSFCLPTSHNLYFYDIMDTCYIYPSVVHYWLVKFMVELINFNVLIIIDVLITHLVKIYILLC